MKSKQVDQRTTDPFFDTEIHPLTGEPSLSGASLRDEAEGMRGTLVPLITSLRTAERLVIDAALLEAFQAAASKHTLAALRSDLSAFDLWCREHRRITAPAGFVDVGTISRTGQGRGHVPHRWHATRPRSRGSISCWALSIPRRPR
jgi:hypothetical protein